MAFDILTSLLVIILLISFFIMYLMNIRIRQLRKELNNLRDRVIITGEELYRLSQDIEDFKKIKI
jgi:cell division protein FtsL